MEEFDLLSLKDFYRWKEKIERKTSSSYVQQRGIIKRPNGDFLMYFDCNRSGQYKPHGKGLRKVKSKSLKIGSKCSSSIRVKVTNSLVDGERVSVKYFKTHENHRPQLDYLRLPKTARASIAEQLKVGVPVPDIINAIQDESFNSNANRICFIKRRDINNIKRDFKIKKEIVGQDYDKASLGVWAKSLIKKGYFDPTPLKNISVNQDLVEKESNNSYVPSTRGVDCNNTTVTPVKNATLTSGLPTLPAPTFDEAKCSPVLKAQMFIQLYQQTKHGIGEENKTKIHDLLNSLITVCSQINNSSTVCTDSDVSNEKDEDQEDSLMLSKKDILIMHNYFKPLSNEKIRKDITEELFELEEVFEESKFYEDMVKDDFVEFNDNILDEVLNIHTEFDHSYF